MSTFVIIGAGSGLGIAAARRFGREGFDVALISRVQDHVSQLASELTKEGITAGGFAADVLDRESLGAALDEVARELGPIEVLQYSPVPHREFLRPVLETDVADLGAAMEFSTLGLATAIPHVLPGMRRLGHGTILLVNGSSAARPNATVAGTSVAFAAESAYGRMLHEALAVENIHVGQMIVPGAIGGGDPLYDPAALADRLWTVYVSQGDFRTTVGA